MCSCWLSHVLVAAAGNVCRVTFHISKSSSSILLSCHLWHTDIWNSCLQCFDTVGWALGRASGLPEWVMRCWFGYLSAAMCRLFAYGPADATAIPRPHHLLPVIWIQTSGTGLPRLLLKRGHWTDVLVVVVVELLISKEWLSYFQVEQQHLSQIITTTGTQGGKEVFSWVVVNKCQ